MAMGQNDSGEGELIRDIGRHADISGHGITREQQLMERADDPLMVREFLARQEGFGQVMQTARPMSREATITLARRVLYGGGPEHRFLTKAPRRYEDRESLLESSVIPAPFEPSAKDYQDAMELGPSTPEAMTVTSGPDLAGLTKALVLTAVLFLALLFGLVLN